MSLPQNSHYSLWSLLLRNDITDAQAHYGCEPSLGSHILSFLTNKLENQRDQYRIWSYNDVGLILICDVPKPYKRRHYYVAKSVSHECIELPYHHNDYNYPLGIVTQTENGVFLSYKVVLLDFSGNSKTELSFLIYSSETGLWSL
ncbi:putative F-box protein [Cardamine amara subsp. amara]|uniref:F-box protein n=1 Tax=Cardamine amara subsp. amara TaxID=228776 RepID=A0ABD1A793_CARAN